MNFTEHEIEECILLQHRIYKLLREHSKEVAFAVITNILLSSVSNDQNKKEDFIEAISKSWDRHMKQDQEET